MSHRPDHRDDRPADSPDSPASPGTGDGSGAAGGEPSGSALGPRRRRLLAALVVVALLVVGAGVVTITRLLDTRVDTTFPDRVARPQAAPIFSGPSSCDKVLGVDQTLLRESTGDVRVEYTFAEQAEHDPWSNTPQPVDARALVKERIPALAVANSSGQPVATRGGAGFFLVKDGVVVGTPSVWADAATSQADPLIVEPADSVTLPVAFGTCDTEITVGTYLVYGVTLVSPAVDGSGELPPLEEAYLVVGEPFVVMLSYDANGVDLVSSVEDHDPSEPLPSPAPRPEVFWPPEVLLTSTPTENPTRLSIVWLLMLDGPFFRGGGIDDFSQRVEDFGYVGSFLPLTCQPGAVDDVVHFEGVDLSEINGYGVAFESREDAQTFADQFAGSRGWYDSVVEDDVFCATVSSTG